MLIYVAIDGDHIGRQVGRASLHNDVEELRRISQAIDHGNQIWTSWVNASLGEMISSGGDEARFRIPPEHLDELEEIRQRYAEAVGSTVSVGVGLELSEADRALLAAKLQGGDRIVFYSPDVDKILDKANEQPKTEFEKIHDEYLGKAQAPVAMNPGAGGFQGAHPAEHPASPQQPAGGQGEHSEAQDVYSLLEESRPPAPEMTHAASDFEEQFHQEASKQAVADQQQAEQSQNNVEQLKAQVVSTLQQIKQMAPILSQLQQSAPQVYQSIMQMTQVMIGMARELAGEQQQMAKSEYKYDHNKSGIQNLVDWADSRSPIKKDGLEYGFAMSEPQIKRIRKAAKKKPKYVKKASLNPGGEPSAHHHQDLPVGSQIDGSTQGTHDTGKVKVQHLDGTQSWIHARAGQIMSQDGHPISSRNPKGR